MFLKSFSIDNEYFSDISKAINANSNINDINKYAEGYFPFLGSTLKRCKIGETFIFNYSWVKVSSGSGFDANGCSYIPGGLYHHNKYKQLVLTNNMIQLIIMFQFQQNILFLKERMVY